VPCWTIPLPRGVLVRYGPLPGGAHIPVLRNIGSLATCALAGGQGEIHAISAAALVWDGRDLLWMGPESHLPAAYGALPSYDAGMRLVVPGLIDCHTHLAFAGWRAEEFEQRLRGVSYQETLRSEGGILATVRRTRAATEEELYSRCVDFLGHIVALGVTTIECKSGYGLDVESELKLLRVYRRLAVSRRARIVATFLGAHTVPPEYTNDRASYVELLVREMLPRVSRERLAAFCDVFVEESAFTVTEAKRILKEGWRLGLAPKLHADQLTACGGAELAAELGAVSADHLECITDAGIHALATAGVVAVSLPVASLYLGQRPLPARRLISAGVRVAVASDFNPGSAPTYHLPMAMLLACTLQRMTPAEVLKGCTLYAAQALGLDGRFGSLEVGKAADFAVIDAPDVNHWLYHFRPNACVATVINGSLRAGRLESTKPAAALTLLPSG
jgi:imidazolonepropionase